MFTFKIHNTDSGNIVAVSDSELLGKHFEENSTVLDISEDFYGGEKADIDTIISAISTCASAIIIGNKIISALKEQDITTQDHIRTISRTPYAMIFKV